MKKVLKWIGIIFVVLIVIGIIADNDDEKPTEKVSVSSGESKSNKSISLSQKEAEFINVAIEDDANVAFEGGDSMFKPDIIFVTASELQNDYSANEARGDKTYKDKNLVITGMVSSIDSSIGDIPVVTLKTNDMFNRVHVRFKKQYRDAAIDLNKNQKVAFFCKGDGVIIGSPTVSDCTPVDVAKSDFINQQKQYVNKAIDGDKSVPNDIKTIIMFAKVAGEKTNDFANCSKIDKKCVNSVGPLMQKVLKSKEETPIMKELKEKLSISN
ncbi:OB-fold protein [Photorhabdus viridis]|uniref:OB-fold protein n=1 Tax=Photorhabdus viridis TaxID=3163327 RepID=UPI0033075C1E